MNDSLIAKLHVDTDLGTYHDLNSLNRLREQSKTSQRETLRAAVKEFEAYFLNEMLKNMRAANKVIADEDSPLSGGDIGFYNEMHDKQLSLELSRSSKFGIGDMLFKQLSVHLPKESEEKASPLVEPNNERFKRQVEAIRSIKAKASQNVGVETSIPVPSAKSDSDSSRSSLTDTPLKSVQSANNYNSNFSNNINNKINDGTLFNGADKKLSSESFSNKQDFIDKLKPLAISAAKKLGLAPGVLIAQAALETGWGKFMSKRNNSDHSFNLFGIKADSRWSGEKITAKTIEFEQGIPTHQVQSFRAYQSFEQSFDDYVNFIQSNPRYKTAIESAGSPEQYLKSIQQNGYATDPDYANKIHAIYSRENLSAITPE
ncbi:MAG: flagellar assembly peptidoglycan hydrolase FlgJ [Kangiellaceae bacterium]|jgi:flagellar protein FlgJ|nr:flagellar assembly peptidoglycan hydrolase FlgJ [Kangiellaceae bacterium]